MADETGPKRSTVLSSVIAHPLNRQQLDDQTDPDSFSDLWKLTDSVMEFYTPSSDNTCMIISTFREMLSKNGAISLMTDIKKIGRDQVKLRAFSRYLIDTILKPMKLASMVNSVALASTPALPNFNATSSITQLAEPARGRREILKDECLLRDGFRCAYSHCSDYESIMEGLFVPPAGMPAGGTHLSHPLGSLTTPIKSREKRWPMFGMLYTDTSLDWGGKIGPDSLNQHQNLITFHTGVREDYDDHRLALNPVDGKINKYEIKNLQGAPFAVKPPQGHREVMTLVSFDNRYPLPEPEFFRAHYQIAKILDATGIGVNIEAEINASYYDPENLSPDGSTDLGSILKRKMLLNI
ncbi:hypothetical protein GCG54_00007136 [Colletotrichum gloeosporioides]|uniref:HNH nuclease domain-containing protein n=1 Tax=Colletotrichum gloeosporioides TaxID=474922 RepID=A0A8H4FM16_COLGL|nr:uncharacterized protein GCG54_00007136 [Colletotrichum gloeosporioides]KAF3806886.1 hypothetical protein GCG54_00007136 [Colletotrichum gloeosporioides]